MVRSYLCLELEEVVLPGARLRENDNLAISSRHGLAIGAHMAETAVQRLLHNTTGRPPGRQKLFCVGQELATAQQQRLGELLVLDVVALRLVPAGVELADAGRKRSRNVVLGLTRLGDRDTVVDGVNVFHEALVQLRVARVHQDLKVPGTVRLVSVLREVLNDGTTKVLVNQARRGELGVEAFEGVSEGALVVVVSVRRRVVHSSNIHNDMAFLRCNK